METESPKEVNIIITKKMEFKEGDIYIIIFAALFLVSSLVLIFFGLVYIGKSDLWLSPSQNIGSFISNLDDFQNITIGNFASQKEINIINKFLNNSKKYNFIKKSKVSNKDKFVVGLKSSFEEFPYQSLLNNNESIVIYNIEENSLHIYSQNFKTLEQVLDLLNENITSHAITINSEEISELILEEP